MRSFYLASRIGAAAATAVMMHATTAALAADLPAIKASADNAVPTCTTPGRLQAYLAKRNPQLEAKFHTIAVDYMREGEALGLRWDIAFFQMTLETGHLSYAKGARVGGVKTEQNNFAGLRPIEKNTTYESFADVATGVRAHLQHVMLYTGESVTAPVAQRTRRLQEMGLLADWRKTIKHEVTFEDLADKWTDGSGTYADRLDDLVKKFKTEFCNVADPAPELMAAARGAATGVAAIAATVPTNVATTDKGIGADLARRAVAEGSDVRSGLGAGSATSNPPAMKLLNAPAAEPPTPDLPASSAATQPAKLPVPQLPKSKATTSSPQATKIAAAGAASKPLASIAEPSPTTKAEPETNPQADQPQPTAGAAAPQKCRVFTASYGGQRAVIVKAVVEQVANFTVLDVNEGQEAREAEAYIAAYARGGTIAGQFATQDKALEKAFELCPEG